MKTIVIPRMYKNPDKIFFDIYAYFYAYTSIVRTIQLETDCMGTDDVVIDSRDHHRNRH